MQLYAVASEVRGNGFSAPQIAIKIISANSLDGAMSARNKEIVADPEFDIGSSEIRIRALEIPDEMMRTHLVMTDKGV